MSQTRVKAKGRREGGIFIPFPARVLEHKNFINLGAKATRLLIDLCSQIRFGKSNGTINNGDLCTTASVMKNRGWSSHETLEYARDELEYYGFIKKTRIGGRKQCHLYAITWWAIDECNGKLDSNATKTPSNEWKEEKPKWIRPKRKQKNKLDSVPRFCTKPAPYNGLNNMVLVNND